MASRETENNAYAKCGVTSNEHYGMLWYFLKWSTGFSLSQTMLFCSDYIDLSRIPVNKGTHALEARVDKIQ